MLEEGIDVAVTTDAGTPCISDPGSVLVREAVQNGIEAVAVPGPTAMASALSVSGFAISEFTFFGFLPRQKGELKEKLLDMARRSRRRWCTNRRIACGICWTPWPKRCPTPGSAPAAI